PETLTAVLTAIYNNSKAPGFAVSVVENNALIYQESFGKADIAGNRPYTNHTIQPIGSISKTFVAGAIVKAIEQGHFTLESDINEILPFEIQHPKQSDAVIKIKHLISHTSGLIDNDEVYIRAYHILPGEDLSSEGAQLMTDGFGIEQRETMPLKDFLAAYFLENGAFYSLDNFASTAPGSNWEYSNIASSLAAYLVEVVSGMSFKDYVETYILSPLDMQNTAYDIADLNNGYVASLYWNKNIPLPKYANDSYPDGSIHTNNEDLSKFLIDMMKGVKGESTTLFSQTGYEMLFESLLPAGLLPSDVGENQGIFWFLKNNQIKHDGSDPGTTCNLQFDKNGQSGFLLLTNMDASTNDHANSYFELSEKIENAVTNFIHNN
ncbi:MAG: beta-lactamase family protein, partial [Saprospiraceae bacterium]|nr:beta-lactamase family protein [Saprospiraceae bacterium]